MLCMHHGCIKKEVRENERNIWKTDISSKLNVESKAQIQELEKKSGGINDRSKHLITQNQNKNRRESQSLGAYLYPLLPLFLSLHLIILFLPHTLIYLSFILLSYITCRPKVFPLSTPLSPSPELPNSLWSASPFPFTKEQASKGCQPKGSYHITISLDTNPHFCLSFLIHP